MNCQKQIGCIGLMPLLDNSLIVEIKNLDDYLGQNFLEDLVVGFENSTRNSGDLSNLDYWKTDYFFI